MPENHDPVIIKKYANRRLYHTGTSSYVTLDDLAHMVRRSEIFVVHDAKTSEDITHAVLMQIIFELESNKQSDNLLPVSFLRQLISYYGDQMQEAVPFYLEQSMQLFANEHKRICNESDQACKISDGNILIQPDAPVTDGTEQNQQILQQAMQLLPLSAPVAETAPAMEQVEKTNKADIQELRDQLLEMQKKIDSLT